ncbi:glycoside hydrolase superfamily [Dendryphion nanum]|uniref:Glycoside hydrolase superfamily n=1 Tax=Dendryphion nanum TaxID=256645 RepID=A0A9P9E446_9PLEO|nr:glycoside hydrolase superfamily [Dendryphion nanum]
MRLLCGTISLLLASVAHAISSGEVYKRTNGSDYQLKEGPLDTDWTKKVGINPWPEYPRPQRQRSNWKSLNGVWRYQNATSPKAIETPPFGKELEEAVLVPFCLESALSGIMRKGAIWSWYRTSFEVPMTWPASERVLLNFGAVDYKATVFVNGKNIGEHTGGYWEFSFDVTDYLSKNGTNELILFVYDPTDMDKVQIPLGKQTLYFNHIFYTPCSGIWQTVWLESAPLNHVTQLDLSADMKGNVNATVHTSSNGSTPVEITIYELNSDDVKFSHRGKSGAPFQFNVPAPNLWSPDSPTLYNVTVRLGNDTIQSYTGFRTISRGVIDGIQRPLLNGKFIFQFGTLDQGYWPDGLHTPPSKEAMIYDLKVLKKIGYNMLRKHIKVEPPLFYQACDQLGLLLIQDMPSLRPFVPNDQCNGGDRVPNPETQIEFERQVDLMIEQHKSYPSIVTWIIYNELWGQRDTKEFPPPEFKITERIRQLDPTRLIDSVSGWNDHGAGDFHDNHKYANPQCGTPFYSLDATPYDPKRIAIQGEFGGIGHNVSAENLWKEKLPIDHINRTYELNADLDSWNYRAHVVLRELREQIERYACSAAVWTQTTDVEGEVNGMLTYDRRIIRPNIEQWNADIKALYDAAIARSVNSTMPAMMPRDDELNEM